MPVLPVFNTPSQLGLSRCSLSTYTSGAQQYMNINWCRLSRPVKLLKVSSTIYSGLVCRGLKEFNPDVSPASTVWSSDLKKTAEVRSNPCSVYSLSASDDTLYSCSNEGTIKGFELDSLKEKVQLIKDERVEFWKVLWANGVLYSGDHEANIRVWKNNTLYGILNVSEPVQDLAVVKNLIFSTKDLYVVVNDVNITGKKLCYMTLDTIMGRAPITLIGENIVAFLSREANDILIYQIDAEDNVTEVTNIQGASDKIINALAAVKWNDKDLIFSGGWDKQIKIWILNGGEAHLDCSLDVDIVVNTITLGEKGEIYIGGSDGHIMRVEVKV